MLLLVDVVSDWDVAKNLAEYESSKLALVNVLRKASGVGEIDAKLPDPEIKKRLDDDMAAVLGHIEESMTKK